VEHGSGEGSHRVLKVGDNFIIWVPFMHLSMAMIHRYSHWE